MSRTSVRVPGIDTVVLSGYIQNIMDTIAGNGHSFNIKRLGVNIAVNSKGKQFLKSAGGDSGWSKCHFIEVASCPEIVV